MVAVHDQHERKRPVPLRHPHPAVQRKPVRAEPPEPGADRRPFRMDRRRVGRPGDHVRFRPEFGAVPVRPAAIGKVRVPVRTRPGRKRARIGAFGGFLRVEDPVVRREHRGSLILRERRARRKQHRGGRRGRKNQQRPDRLPPESGQRPDEPARCGADARDDRGDDGPGPAHRRIPQHACDPDRRGHVHSGEQPRNREPEQREQIGKRRSARPEADKGGRDEQRRIEAVAHPGRDAEDAYRGERRPDDGDADARRPPDARVAAERPCRTDPRVTGRPSQDGRFSPFHAFPRPPPRQPVT